MKKSSLNSSQINDYFHSREWHKAVIRAGGGGELVSLGDARKAIEHAERVCQDSKARAHELAEKFRAMRRLV